MPEESHYGTAVRWIPDGPEVPLALVCDLEDGNVVLFCGAGVSKPAGLPLFKELTEQLYDGVPDAPPDGPELIGSNQFDRALYLLEEHAGAGNVRERVPGFLELDPNADVSTHEAILKLATCLDGGLRLVTTNYDRAFARAADNLGRKQLTIHCAPALPVPKKGRWSSLVYLHGCLDPSDPSCKSLVLTSADFGLAYLTEQWASAFVTELFRNFTVLFVGYSVEDPVMRYMMDAFAADRKVASAAPAKKAYAFDGTDENIDNRRTAWLQKGIEPIIYKVENKSHEKLPATLKTWAAQHSQGMRGKNATILKHARSPLLPSEAEQVCWALSDSSGAPARFFAEISPPPPIEWLPALENAGLLGGRLSESGPSGLFVTRTAQTLEAFNPITRHLIGWLSKHLREQQFVNWLVQRGSHLNPFARYVFRQALLNETLPAGLDTFWNIVTSKSFSESSANPFFETSMQDFLDAKPWPGSLKFALLDALAPRLELNPPWSPPSYSEQSENTLGRYADIKVLLREDQQIKQIWEAIEKNGEKEKILLQIADELTSLLKNTVDLLLIGNDGQRIDLTYADRPSIEDHEQNSDPYAWTLLIPMLREAFLCAVKADKRLANGMIARWKLLRFPIFTRFVLFAARRSDLVPNREILDLLAEADGFTLWSHHVQRELFQLLKHAWPSMNELESKQLIELVLAGPPRTILRVENNERYQEYRALMVRARLRALRSPRRELPAELQPYLAGVPTLTDEQEERSQFPIYATSGWGGLAANFTDPTTDLKSKSDLEVVSILDNLTGEGGYVGAWRSFVRGDVDRAARLLTSHPHQWPSAVWREVLGSFNTERPPVEVWNLLCPSLLKQNCAEQIAPDIALALRSVSRVIGDKDEACFESVWTLAAKLVFETLGDDIDPDLTRSLNAPAGAMADAILSRLAARSSKPERIVLPANVPTWIWDALSVIADARSISALPAQVLVASRTTALFNLNRRWATDHLLPLLEWEQYPYARPLWRGFLWQFRVNFDLLSLIKEGFLKALRVFVGEAKTIAAASQTFVSVLLSFPGSIGNAAATDIIRDLPTQAREMGAMALWQLIDASGAGADEFWKDKVSSWLQNVWPQGHACRSQGTSYYFALAAFMTKEQFPAAVDLVCKFVGELESDSFARNLFARIFELSSLHPADVLRLLALLVGETTKLYGPEIRKLVESAVECKPDLAQTPDYRKLDEAVSRVGH